MPLGLAAGGSCSAYEHTGNMEPVAQHLEGLCVALAYVAFCSVKKGSGGVGFGIVAVCRFIIIVFRVGTDIIVNILEGFVSGAAFRYCADSSVDAVRDSSALVESAGIIFGFLYGY